MKTHNNVEILAPCGSMESLKAAINAGANSVYFGASNLNMRSGSSVNFTIEDLKEITQLTKEANVRTYLTLNTIMYDSDIDKSRLIIDKAKEFGINSIIVSDFAVIDYAFNQGMPLHISTQANISNYESVKFFSKYADVMVLARELDLEQVKYINSKIIEDKLCGPSGELVKIELFAHGALCMAISGKWYLSLHEWNKSPNRGSCLQTCRRAYSVKDKESGYELEIDNEYIMSPKDLRTIHFLDRILDAGVSVLKIEGRGRSPEYVKYTVEAYREAAQSINEGTYSEEKVKKWEAKLSKVYNRGFWDGYYLGKKIGEWSGKYGSQATEKKVFIGEITNYFPNLKVAEVSIKTGELAIDDKIMVIGSSTGVYEGIISELRDDNGNIQHALKGTSVAFPVKDRLRKKDQLYKIVDSAG